MTTLPESAAANMRKESMVQADRQIRNEQYAPALRTLNLILELREAHDLALPESFWMKRAQAWELKEAAAN